MGGWRESARLNQSSRGAHLAWLPVPLTLHSPPFVLLKDNSHVPQREKSMMAKGTTSQVGKQSRAQRCSSVRAMPPPELEGCSLLRGVPCLCSALSLLQEFCSNVQFFADPASFWQRKGGGQQLWALLRKKLVWPCKDNAGRW